ncbi:MAG: FtsX-like permease family protein [Olsenella sp.]|nr:FtsX-like permease family protein [Olsenella sp.]
MRSRTLYPRLAANSLRTNARFYLPYLIACAVVVALHYDMQFLGMNEGLNQLPGASSVLGLLAVVILAYEVFSTFIFFYTNGFMMKQRQRELGLYSILGMDRHHIRRLLRWEAAYCSCIIIGGGILLGIALSRGFVALFGTVMQVDVPIGFEVQSKAVIYTSLVYAVMLFLNLAVNLARASLSRPVELLRGTSAGDREPKTRWLTAIIGCLALTGGYLISFTAHPLEHLSLFLAAVLLVVVATYCLFSAGSIALLKRLRANKAYYYQARHFFTVSGMLHRMRRNAAGLATVCVFSTMTLVMSSTTLCMYLGAGSTALRAGDPQLRSVLCGYFFAGLFLSTLFLMASGLILYYKQISESHEDARSYVIMQQVGMTDQEVWSAIRGQAPLAFLPPLAVAAVHSVAALPMTGKILAALGIGDVWFVLLCCIATILAYAVVYFGVFRLTSYEYYRIVRRHPHT